MTAAHADLPVLARAEAEASRPSCRLCGRPGLVAFATIRHQTYWRCEGCEAILLDETCLLSGADEHAYYGLHENDVHDPGYRAFVSRLGDPLLERLKPVSEGLDYGCGPGPALAAILGEHGHRVSLYDPFFHPGTAVLDRSYDFIICCEVAEHFHRPGDEFERLDALLRPGGWLGLMTCFRTDDRLFANWHYRHDPTHVVFYREQTLRSIAARFGWSCAIPRKDVAIMRKPGAAA
ncbi:class I SAM-dependent methyltransferase [Hoeflea sp.]|uniref:class I SAM-dependent methyltransferase n=1 Tax=Hoeflea sp. TaxID=1940281 RepID=UPI0019B84FE6|nr:class I SAM-dependent methyltransferase [Hoeflea sp.]MBC7284330.1 class I SAM-dependent methyltransferase [Hoeflea sp.]